MRDAVIEHLLPGAQVVHDPDGAPRLVGHAGHISIAHDGDWVAVAHGDTPVGIDLCLRRYEARTRTILTWLRIDVIDPVAQFAAIEAALKLRHLGIERVLDRDLSVERDGRDIVVHGLGDDVRVHIHDDHPDYVVAVCG
jgi:hypothetical protein